MRILDMCVVAQAWQRHRGTQSSVNCSSVFIASCSPRTSVTGACPWASNCVMSGAPDGEGAGIHG
jgi:hypothetical protein